MRISVKKEKAVVFVTSVMAVVTGFIASIDAVAAAAVGSLTAAALLFWSEGINTGEAS